MDSARDKYVAIRRVLVLTLFGNLLVAVLKLVVGSITSSLAMVADGLHSSLDSSSNVVGFIAIYFAYKPPDEDHRYGHRKFETFSAMVISVLLFAAAWHVVQDAIARLRSPVMPEVTLWSFVVMGVSLGVNLLVSSYELRRGRELKSELLLSDAQHTRSDIFVTLTVVASLVASRLGYPLLDTLASLLIAGIIVVIGFRIVRRGLDVLSDVQVIEPEDVRAALDGIAGIEGSEDVRTRGPDDHVFMDLTIYVAPETPLAEAHALADRVEARIRQRFPGVVDIVVHMEPTPHPETPA